MQISLFVLLLIVAACLADAMFFDARRPATPLRFYLLRFRFRLRSLLLIVSVLCTALAAARLAFMWGGKEGILWLMALLSAGGLIAATVAFVVREFWTGNRCGRLMTQMRNTQKAAHRSGSKGTGDKTDRPVEDNSSRRPIGTRGGTRPRTRRCRAYDGSHDFSEDNHKE